MSMKLIAPVIVTLFLLFGVGTSAAQAQDPPPNPHVVIETSMGAITIELFRPQARVSVTNFLTYVQAGFYDGTIFHRVLRNRLIQGGSFTPNHERKMEGLRGGILNEATNNLENDRGTIATARGSTPNSARAGFFINTNHNHNFNHRNTTDAGYGYAVFGKVVEGMEVVDNISQIRTTSVDDLRNVPRELVLIKTIRRINP